MLIEFSEFNYKLLLPFIFPLFNQLQDLSNKAYMIPNEDNHIFVTFRYFVSYLFSGIFLLILKYNTRRTTKRSEIKIIDPITGNKVYLLTKKQDKKSKIKNILFILLLCLIGVSTFYCRYFFYRDEFYFAEEYTRAFCEIIIFTGLSILILKQKLYLHHFVSSGCIIFLLVIEFISSILFIKNFNITISCFLYYSLIALAFGLYDVLMKKHMNVFLSTPYYLMFMIGIINVIVLIIFDTFAYFFKPEIGGIISGLKKNINNVGDLFMFFLDLILEFGWNLGILLVIYYYTPCHYFISEYISDYIYYIRNYVSNKDNNNVSSINVIIFSICYAINFFCILVFNEIIILNFCNLDYNTKKRIQERVEKDSESLEDRNLSKERENSLDSILNDEYNLTNNAEKINSSSL